MKREMGQEVEVGDILRLHLDEYLKEQKVPFEVWKALKALEKCRRSENGYHLRECEECGYQGWAYNSCKDRHCPKCSWGEQYEWVKGVMKGEH